MISFFLPIRKKCLFVAAVTVTITAVRAELVSLELLVRVVTAVTAGIWTFEVQISPY